MRLAGLFSRSRLAGYAALCVPVVALVAWASMLWLLSQGAVSVESGGFVPILVYGTLAVAVVIGVGSNSPFGEIERTAARPLLPLRLAHLAGLLLWGAPVLIVCLLYFDLRNAAPAYPLLVLLRNLVGISGLALLTARLLGAQTSWTLPLVFVAVALIAGRNQDGSYAAWAWVMQSGHDYLSWTISLALFLFGLGVVCLLGAWETS